MSEKGVDGVKIKAVKKRCSINSRLRAFIMVLSISLILGMFINLYSVFNTHKFIERKESLYSYNMNAKVSYSAVLKPNAYDLYGGQKKLSEGNTYITDLIDVIDPNLMCEFVGERSAKISGNYQVYALIQGSLIGDKNGKPIWQKKIIIQDKTNFNANNKEISIKADNPIKLNYYKQLIDTTIKETNIQFNIKFTIYWDVQLTAETSNGIIKESVCPTMEIPLYSNTFEVGGQLSSQKNSALQKTIKVPVPINKNMEVLSIALIILSVAVLFIFTVLTTNSDPCDPLTKKIKSIFKEHGDRLVTLRGDQNISFQTIINVEDIKDLVRVADELGKPILYYHSEDINQITKFYVIDDKIVYLCDIERLFEKP